MDGQRFDQMARMLASGVSRRGVLRGLAAGLAGAAGLRVLGAQAGQEKQALCHATGDPAHPWVVISVAAPAWDTHFAHDDHPFGGCCEDADCDPGLTCCGGVCFDLQTDPNHCGACGTVCTGGTTCAGGVCAAACGASNAPCATDTDCCSGICRGALGCCPTCPSDCFCSTTDFQGNLCAKETGSGGDCSAGQECPAGEACFVESCRTTCPSLA